MKRFLMLVTALFFPWLTLLIYDNPGGALVALFLQCTIIGWIPATVWAWKMVQEEARKKKRHKKYGSGS